jgi:hypothetical protein
MSNDLYDYGNSDGNDARMGASNMGATLGEASSAGVTGDDDILLAGLKIQNHRTSRGLDPYTGQPHSNTGPVNPPAGGWILPLIVLAVLGYFSYNYLQDQYFSPKALERRKQAAHLEVKAECKPAREFAPFSFYEPFAKGHEAYAKLSYPDLLSLTKAIPAKDKRHRLVGAEVWRRYIASTGRQDFHEAERAAIQKTRGLIMQPRNSVVEFLGPLAAAGNVNAIADLGTYMVAADDWMTNPFLGGVKIWKSGVEKVGADPVLSKLIADYESQCKPQFDSWKVKWNVQVGS